MGKLNYKEFYHRNLPHFQPKEAVLAITFRLAFSLPKIIMKELQYDKEIFAKNSKILKNEKYRIYKREFEKKYFEKFDDFLAKYKLPTDWLSNESIANIVQESIHFFDKKMYHLFAYCIMPNHVHLILKPLENDNGSLSSISKIMYSIKRYSATKSNKVLKRQGAFWHHENYDHVIRNTKDFHYQINYLLSNPVKANLVDTIEEWKYSWVVSSV